ncbi:MAG TPA: hypothetical protein EYO73_09235 [Sulfurimonas sp.]|nr:hypothetical protein [Sulfurimonas sp.]
MKKILISLAVASLLTTSLFADAETDALRAQLKAMTERLDAMETKTSETEEKTDSLLQEVADSKVADSFGNYSGESYAGMSPGASKVYTNKNKLSVGGYGKVDYTNYRNQGTTTKDGVTKTKDKADAYRAVLYFGYRFTDNIILNSEIEFEHGGSAENGETEVEMLALDFLVNKSLNFRVGTYVLPIGLVAVNHEPTLFNTVARPTTEVDIIPSTWFENGAMVYGDIVEGLRYQTGIVAGFDATKGSDLRKMRSKGSKSAADDAGYFARIDYSPIEGLNIAGSYYYGNAGQNASTTVGGTGANEAVSLNDVDVNLWEVHATAKLAGFEANVMYATHKIGSAEEVARFHNNKATDEAFGYYANLNYTYGDWVPFAQYEVTNKYDKGVNADSTTFSYEDTKQTTIGLNWKPHPQVVLKADYVFADKGEEGKTVDDDRFELGMGFVF